jgi:hypothetical protein
MKKWKIIDQVPDAYIGYRAIIDEEGFTVCDPSPMGEENARLIAAAPDLLAALKTCRAWVAQYHDLKGHDAASRHLTDYLDRVISNAEGEAV